MPMYSHAGGAVLPFWLQVEITEPQDGTKRVLFHSKIHRNRVVKNTFSFSEAFSDHEILRDADLLKRMRQLYGDDVLHVGQFGVKGR